MPACTAHSTRLDQQTTHRVDRSTGPCYGTRIDKERVLSVSYRSSPPTTAQCLKFTCYPVDGILGTRYLESRICVLRYRIATRRCFRLGDWDMRGRATKNKETTDDVVVLRFDLYDSSDIMRFALCAMGAHDSPLFCFFSFFFCAFCSPFCIDTYLV
jgi:hypothetical protein